MRTTIDIEDPILRDLKRLRKQEGKSLGRLVSEMLAQALAGRNATQRRTPPFRWRASRGTLLVDLLDKEALRLVLDEPIERRPRR